MPASDLRPSVLIIRDGWGRNPNPEHHEFNAVELARTPVSDELERDYPHTLIHTSGEDVGLPEGTMGNSEVGHQNIGAGRIVDQVSVRITKACRDGSLRDIENLVDPIATARDAGRDVHIMGICSDAGVHGMIEHLVALLDLCGYLRAPRVFLHLFTDGRDTGPFTGAQFIREVEAETSRLGVGTIASIMGRYWSMDRDYRWDRVERAYACLTGRNAEKAGVALAGSASEALEAHYESPADAKMTGDEFTPPTMIAPDRATASRSRITDGDTIIFYNYRGDRPREIVSALALSDDQWAKVKPSPSTGKPGFDRGPRLKASVVCMTAYSEALAPFVRVAFPKPPKMTDTLGQYLSGKGLTQFRCAETEKFAHVTFFFNDYREEPFPGEHRVICPSPTAVSTYDQKPEMSAHAVRDAVLARLAAPDCEPCLIVNFANGDMVGHTGNLQATIRACEIVDECVGAIVKAALARGGSLIVTADHGNAEQMFDPATNAPHTAHTIYDVPLIVVGERFRGRMLRSGGRLADIAPTILEIMGLNKPEAMTGESLLA